VYEREREREGEIERERRRERERKKEKERERKKEKPPEDPMQPFKFKGHLLEVFFSEVSLLLRPCTD
jgi:hypothetical protein